MAGDMILSDPGECIECGEPTYELYRICTRCQKENPARYADYVEFVKEALKR